MSPIGFVIVFLCFAGPVLPPLIGTVVGTLWDARKLRRSRVRERRPARGRVVADDASLHPGLAAD